MGKNRKTIKKYKFKLKYKKWLKKKMFKILREAEK